MDVSPSFEHDDETPFDENAGIELIPDTDNENHPSDDDDDDDKQQQQDKSATSMKNDDHDDDDEAVKSSSSSTTKEEQEKRRPSFAVLLSSNLLFLCGSAMYQWLAILDLQWAKELQAWAGIIDGEFSLRDNAVQEIKNFYENADDDDAVFQVRFHKVSKYQIVWFIAAFCFMVEGFVDFFGTPDWRGIFFIFAGTTGVVAAWLGERDANLSTIYDLISAHLYMAEAITLIIYRNDYKSRALRAVVLSVDVLFLVATTIDVALSYTSLFKVFKMALTKTDVASAALWLFCGAFYVGATSYAKAKGHFDTDENKENSGEEDPFLLAQQPQDKQMEKPFDEDNVSA